MWGERVITAPTARVVELTEVKEFLRIDGEDTDTELVRLIEVATQRVQNLCRRQLITATRRVYFDDWPLADTVYLPWSPLQSVSSIKYIADTTETLTTISSTNYRVDTDAEPGRIKLIPSYVRPLIAKQYGAFQVEYVCGYGDAATSVPEPLRHAVMLSVGHFYENRSEITRQAASVVPNTVQHLLDQYTVGDEFFRYGATSHSTRADWYGIQ